MEVENGNLIARGRTAEVYRQDGDRILKLFYSWCPADWAKREDDTSMIVYSKGLPIPKCIGTVSVAGRNGIVFNKVDGDSMLSIIGRKPWTLKAHWRTLARLHSQIHLQTGDGLPQVKPYLERSISANTFISQTIKVMLLEVLTELENGTALCHFDFHPGQVILSKSGPMVLDWMTACQGSPLADIARTIVILSFGSPPNANWLVRRSVGIVGHSFRTHYPKEYSLQKEQIDMSAIAKWMLPIAAARLMEEIPGEKAPILSFIARSLGIKAGA